MYKNQPKLPDKDRRYWNEQEFLNELSYMIYGLAIGQKGFMTSQLQSYDKVQI